MASILIAVDPGIVSGFAVFSRDPIKPALLFAREIEVRKHPQELTGTMDDAQSYVDPYIYSTHMILESQYQGAGRSFPAIRSLIEICGYIRYTALAHGIEVQEVMPASWQAILRIRGCRLKSAQLKALAREVVQARYGHDIASIGEHACDAICMGMWWLQEMAIKSTRKGGDPR